MSDPVRGLLFLERGARDTTLCPKDLQLRPFVSTRKTKVKRIATAKNLRYPYVIFMLSLRSLRFIRPKGKLKNRMAWIEEINSEPSESVIPAIERLYFTSCGAPISIAVLGRNQVCPVDL
jgi:hypothetical protein